MSKVELTLSTGYVPDWTYIEAIREIFQNALDKETQNEDNKMFVDYDGVSTLRIGNKTSVLELNSLLMGESTKRDDKNTIGKHGEGYKVAFLVLLREGRRVKVYNYGKKEVWDCKLVKSRRFKTDIVSIDVDKKFVWQSVPDSNLVFEVTGISPDEYEKIKNKNLHLREVGDIINTCQGRILLENEFKGSIYVNGLYITTTPELHYGYDFKPAVISLDRDRRMINSIDLKWETSKAWDDSGEIDKIIKLLNINAHDVYYIDSTAYKNRSVLKDKLVEDFKNNYGENAVPVSSNEDLDKVIARGVYKPILVSSTVSKIVNDVYKEKLIEDKRSVDEVVVSDLLKEWKSRASICLTNSLRLDIEFIIKKVEELEELNKDLKNQVRSSVKTKIRGKLVCRKVNKNRPRLRSSKSKKIKRRKLASIRSRYLSR